jgi:hypothetical protein
VRGRSQTQARKRAALRARKAEAKRHERAVAEVMKAEAYRVLGWAEAEEELERRELRKALEAEHDAG